MPAVPVGMVEVMPTTTSAGRSARRRVALLVTGISLFLATGIPAADAGTTPNAVTFDGVAAIGALFTVNPKGQLGAHFCTGTVVDSASGDLVLTAAHCVLGRSAQSIVFVPGYAKGATPYGVWDVTMVMVDAAWSAAHDPDDDVAFLTVAQPKSATTLLARTGGERLDFDEPTRAVATVIGYPDDRRAPVECTNTVVSFRTTQFKFSCGGFTTGTSGGPMLTDVDPETGEGTVIGVIGGYQRGGDTPSISYAAKFESGVKALFATTSS